MSAVETQTQPIAPRPGPGLLSYVLITPARNEEQFIEGTIKSVVAQTHRPARWIIVSDGSTDKTDEIVAKYAEAHPWIELMRLPERRDRQFAAKANAFNAAYATLKDGAWDVIGNLDADITFDEAYFDLSLLGRFSAEPGLGVAGTPFVEDEERKDQHTPTRINLPNWTTFQARANSSDGRALKGWVDIPRSKGAPSIGWP